jgi:hypothetical protein
MKTQKLQADHLKANEALDNVASTRSKSTMTVPGLSPPPYTALPEGRILI